MDPINLFIAVLLLAGALGFGWYAGSRKGVAVLAAAEERAKQVPGLQAQLDEVRRACGEAQTECARLNAAQEERERAFEARLAELKEARETMSAQFSEIDRTRA